MIDPWCPRSASVKSSCICRVVPLEVEAYCAPCVDLKTGLLRTITTQTLSPTPLNPTQLKAEFRVTLNPKPYKP